MTTPDRTEDLLRLMLERRAGAPPPGWLLPGVAEAVRQTGQARSGNPWTGLLSTRRFGRLGLVAAAALILLALAAGVLVASRFILPPPQPTLPAVVVLPSPSATLPPATPEPRTEPANEPQTVPPPAPPALAPDTVAVVTKAGDDLRVRSKPSVGADSEKLSPLLKKGTRMLVVKGPVFADTYDWYEVQADNGLFGWVATGKDGEDWIEPTEPNCTDDLDESALWTVDPIDFLVCYGDAPVEAHVLKPQCCDTGSVVPACPWTGDDVACNPRPSWLFDLYHFSYVDPDSPKRGLSAGVPRSGVARMGDVPENAAMTLTVAMDAPQAEGCRIVDSQGRDLISRDEAITRCRLTFAVREVAWDPDAYLSERDSLAIVTEPHVPLHTAPDGPLIEPRLDADDKLLVVAGPVPAAGVNWYAVVPYSRMVGRVGWIPATSRRGQWNLQAASPHCPSSSDIREWTKELPAVLLACFGSDELTLDLTVVRQTPHLDWGACDRYNVGTGSPPPCAAMPDWLATYSGVTATDSKGRGMDFELHVDPARIAVDGLPTTPERMRVTGSFANDASAGCKLVNRDTGELLVDPLEAAAYCRSQFVVTRTAPIP